MAGNKILYYLYLIKERQKKNESLNSELEYETKKYLNNVKSFNNVTDIVYSENEKSINDFKTIFNSIYNSEIKKVHETFDSSDRIFYNNGFELDSKNGVLIFSEEKKEEQKSEYHITKDNTVVFFFDNEVELNFIEAIIKDRDGLSIVPNKIIVENKKNSTYFLEDFSRYFNNSQEGEKQTFVSNVKKVKKISFYFDIEPNLMLSSFKFYKKIFKNENEIVIKFENIFKNNDLIKLKRNISDKLKTLSYSISEDNGITFKEFEWKNPELNGLDIEDDVKVLSLHNKKVSDIYIKILADKSNVNLNVEKVTNKETFVKNISFDYEESVSEFKLDPKGGVIKKESIKVYFSNKNKNIINNANDKILNTIEDPGKAFVENGLIEITKDNINQDDEFFLTDYDDLDSLSNIGDKLGFFVNDTLYMPVLFSLEKIGFRIKYDVEFYDNDLELSTYTPFIFDLDIAAGDS